MKYYFLGVWLIGLGLSNLYAQDLEKIQVGEIPLSSVQYLTQDTTGVYYHPKLVARFEDNPRSLSLTDYYMLYYGQAFSENYNPYYYRNLEDSLSQLTEAQKGQEALALANLILAANPVSVFALIEKAYALNSLGNKDEALIYLDKYQILMNAIESSGEGSSYENPIVLISPKDAEAFILRYKLVELSRSINGDKDRYYDVFLVRNSDEKQYPIYFDITLAREIGLKKLLENPNSKKTEE